MKLENFKNYLTEIKTLFEQAFPENERCDFEFLLNDRYPNYEMFAITKNNQFLGFIFVAIHKKLAYINYFAIKENVRCCGFGSEALKLLKQKFSGFEIMLSIEKPVSEIQKRRLSFYQRNDFFETGFELTSNCVDFCVLCYGKFDLELLAEFFKLYFPNAQYK